MKTIFVLYFLGLYPYILYPLFVWLLGRVINRPVRKTRDLKTVTVVIAAHNEEEFIERTIRNKLDQNYPSNLLDVIVVSDESTDDTDEIVLSLADETSRVTLMRQMRRGKTAGLNKAITAIESEIIVFSDANSIHDETAIRELVGCFSDPDVGYVTGQMKYHVDPNSIAGAGSDAYMRYENLLRKMETRVGSVVGVDGGIDAIRRGLYVEMRDDQLPDFVLPLLVVRQGYRVVFEPGAILREDSLKSSEDEYRMRVRVSGRAMRALFEYWALLNPFHTGPFAWQLFSHKWMRYFSFIPLAFAVFFSFLFFGDAISVNVLVIVEVVFFMFVAIAWVAPIFASKMALSRWCTYFFLLNLASANAFLRILAGERFTTWQPRKG